MYKDDEERERPSWRELDALKDRSRHVVQEKKPESPKKAFAKKRDDNAAKKALNDFFQGKKSKEQEVDWKKVEEVSGKLFYSRAKTYIEKHGLPRQWDDLLRLLDHNDPSLLGQVLDRLLEVSTSESSSRLDVAIGKLRILQMMCEEPSVLQKTEQVLNEFSSRI